MKRILKLLSVSLSFIVTGILFGCAANTLPEGEKTSFGFHRIVEGKLNDKNIYVACIVNATVEVKKDDDYIPVQLFYGFDREPSAGTANGFKVYLNVSSPTGMHSTELKEISGQEFFTEKYHCEANSDFDGVTVQPWYRYEYQFNHSEVVNVPIKCFEQVKDDIYGVKFWASAKSETDWYESYPLYLNGGRYRSELPNVAYRFLFQEVTE